MKKKKEEIEDKIAKICWNSEGWKFPSGSKGKSVASTSFEVMHGYGYEEWLFDKSRIIDGYHYAFLQPLNLKSNKHVRKIYNIFLYAITNGIKYFIGNIKNVYCISKTESKGIYMIYKRNGWLTEMAEDIERAGAKPMAFRNEKPERLFNIRFKFADLSKPDEAEEISEKDINITTTRYKLLPKLSNFKIVVDYEKGNGQGKLKNTSTRKRIYKGGISFDPYHDKMQNALYLLLEKKYKNEYKSIYIEKDRVDVKAKTHANKWHYFEIKTDIPRLSIRNALGQIMEYSYWPNLDRATKLIIVSDNAPNRNTKKYLAHIRNKFRIPVFYRFFDLEKNFLSDDY